MERRGDRVTELTVDVRTMHDVPVEVYDAGLRLVDRTLSSKSVTVDAGTHFVLAHLPDGSQLRQSIVVRADQSATTVQLEPSVSEPFEAVAADEYTAEVVGYHRDKTGAWREVLRQAVTPRVETTLSMPIELDAIGLTRPDGQLTFARIPGRRMRYFRVTLGPGRDGSTWDLAMHLANETADALLGYLNQDLLGDASVLVESPKLAAENLLWSKGEDPVAAAAGAFALLRLDDLKRLHNWTTNLANRFEWLPDGLVAQAEHLARLGKHDHAVKLLRRLPERGLPALSIGLGYATDRLRTYSANWPDDKELRSTLEELTRYAVATDFAAPVTTFTGKRPDAPVAPERERELEFR
jgi:hypothetical protein